ALRHLAAQRGVELHIDSCGVGWAHLGEHPDRRTFESAKKRGILIDHRSQQFQDHFFDEFDLILTVSRDISEQLKLRTGKKEHHAKVRLATEFSRGFKGKEIPDPYYMSADGFDDVMEMILDCSEGLLDHLGQ
ncbi:MAG TPA: hypothetical protein VLE89_07720, partial [Chlamydiales bacterium]|nr:hypothetical protein [Chlamydiales bacterium]